MSYDNRSNSIYQTEKYYKESGVVKFRGILLILAFGIFGATILSIIYIYIGNIVSLILKPIISRLFIYGVKTLLTLGYAYALWFLVSKAAKIGEIRNKKVVILFTLIIGNYSALF